MGQRKKNKNITHVYVLYAILTHLCSCTLVSYTWKEKNKVSKVVTLNEIEAVDMRESLTDSGKKES